MASGGFAFLLLAAMVALIIVLTGRCKINAFPVLLLVAFGYGVGIGLPLQEVLAKIKEGFGGTLANIGVVITAGTMVGVILEKTGAALVMTRSILGLVGKKRAPLAMNIAGMVVSVPVFCDSGYVILTPLNRALAKESGQSMVVMAVALATGLFATHCMVPPTPGPIAAAGTLSADLGMVILYGVIAAVPASLAAYVWAAKAAVKYDIPVAGGESYSVLMQKYGRLPSAFLSFLPLILPIFLILLKSIAALPSHPFGETVGAFLSTIGDPILALTMGFLCSFLLVPGKHLATAADNWLGLGIRDAAAVLVITGAGGALGRVIQASPIVDYIRESMSGTGVGIFFPFIIAAALKTAQGSSTVAIITTANIMAPMSGQLGVNPALCVVAIGAGAMVVSHANDSFFWVVSQFSDLPVDVSYKVYTTATAIEGVVAIGVVYCLSLVV